MTCKNDYDLNTDEPLQRVSKQLLKPNNWREKLHYQTQFTQAYPNIFICWDLQNSIIIRTVAGCVFFVCSFSNYTQINVWNYFLSMQKKQQLKIQTKRMRSCKSHNPSWINPQHFSFNVLHCVCNRTTENPIWFSIVNVFRFVCAGLFGTCTFPLAFSHRIIGMEFLSSCNAHKCHAFSKWYIPNALFVKCRLWKSTKEIEQQQQQKKK